MRVDFHSNKDGSDTLYFTPSEVSSRRDEQTLARLINACIWARSAKASGIPLPTFTADDVRERIECCSHLDRMQILVQEASEGNNDTALLDAGGCVLNVRIVQPTNTEQKGATQTD